jgi:hypothetical protein
MKVYISYAVKLSNKPVICVYHVANEDEAKKAAIAYFDNTLTDVIVTEYSPFAGVPRFLSEDILKNAEFIVPFEVEVSNKYLSAVINDTMHMTIKANDNAMIGAYTDDFDDSDILPLNTSYLKIMPMRFAIHVNNEVKEVDKE